MTQAVNQLSPAARGVYDLLVERRGTDRPFLLGSATTAGPQVSGDFIELVAAGLVTERRLYGNVSKYELTRGAL